MTPSHSQWQPPASATHSTGTSDPGWIHDPGSPGTSLVEQAALVFLMDIPPLFLSRGGTDWQDRLWLCSGLCGPFYQVWSGASFPGQTSQGPRRQELLLPRVWPRLNTGSHCKVRHLMDSTLVSQLRAVNNPDTHLGRHKKPLSPPCLLQTSHCPSPPPCSPLGRHSLSSILVKEKERKGEAATSAANRSFAASCLAPAWHHVCSMVKREHWGLWTRLWFYFKGFNIWSCIDLIYLSVPVYRP